MATIFRHISAYYQVMSNCETVSLLQFYKFIIKCWQWRLKGNKIMRLNKLLWNESWLDNRQRCAWNASSTCFKKKNWVSRNCCCCFFHQLLAMSVIHPTGDNILSVFVTSMNALLKLFQNLPILAESSDLHSIVARGNCFCNIWW